jgi:DNA-binding beta-propeller fold protein YncE
MSHARVVPASLLATLIGLLLAAAPAAAALYDNSFLYASNYDDGQVDRLAVDALGALGASTAYAASPQATSIVVNPEATALFAGSSAGDTIDGYSIGAGGDLTSHAATAPAKGSDLAMTPDGAFLYAIKADSGPASSGSLQGYAVSGSTLTQLSPTHTLPAARIATAIAISPDGLSLYVAAADTWNGTNGFLQRYAIDPQTGALSGPTLEASGFTASVFNLALSPDGLSLYAPSPSADVVYQFDVTPSTGALAPKAAPTVAAGTGPYSVAVTPNGKFAYANGLFAVSGFAIDATTGALAPIGAPVPTQFLGRGSAVSPDSRNLYVTAYPAHHFTIDPGTGLLTARGSSPCCRFHVGLAFTPDQGPVASFTAVAAPEGLATTFDASASTDSDGTVATYLWDFHDGPKVTGGPTISHTFGSAGSHTVDLTVTDDMGCSNTRTYTGHMVHCNGTAAARQTKTVVITPVAPPVVVPPAVVDDPAPVPPAVETPGPAATPVPPSVDGLRVSRRCVRSAARAAFAFTLSQDATVRYEVLRRNGSPKWTSCPRLGGTTPITFGSLWQWAAAVGAGRNDTTLATASAHHTPIRMRMRQGRHRVALTRIAARLRLTPGTHLLRVTATNANGQSAVTQVKFWIIGPER